MKSDKLFYICAGLVFVFIFVLIVFAAQSKNSSKTNSDTVSQDLLIGRDSPTKGDTKIAKVVLVEFSDFQCPACKAYHTLVNSIIANHPDEVALVYRHLPLFSIHYYSKEAAIAAEAAKKQGKFFEYGDKLFDNQRDNSNPLKGDDFVSFAKDLGLDTEKFKSDLKSQEVISKVDSDVQFAYSLGLNSTPTFYINGNKLSLDQDLEAEINKILQSK